MFSELECDKVGGRQKIYPVFFRLKPFVNVCKRFQTAMIVC